MKKTKIVCTIGPVTESVETLKELLNRGMNVMRLNFSHGDYEEHGTRIKNFRQAMSETGKRAGLLLDTKGPEIRTMSLEDGKDVFFHYSQLMMEGFKTIDADAEVEFDLVETDRGLQAHNIVKA